MKPKPFSSAGVAASDAPVHRGSCRAFARPWTGVFAALGLLSGVPALAAEVHGQILSSGAAIIDSAVTLWAAGTGAPQQLAQTRTGADGRFVVNGDGNGAVLYLVAKGGHLATKANGVDALALMSVLGTNPPADVVVNELTTVASAFTAARFIGGEAISGNPLGLRIAAGNAPNLVDPVTGNWARCCSTHST